jgi:4-hydroxy-tetrahydrodipicolinate reductase
MRIALIGYGKMGKMIEEIALERDHHISMIIHLDNVNEFTQENMANTDVAIEFTGPDSAFENVIKCIQFGIPVISGSTGWNEKLVLAKKYCKEQHGAFLHASNFSIGVNIFFEMNVHLAKLMANQPTYDINLKEIHHTQKKDSPSGTAVTLAEQIIEHHLQKDKWVNTEALNENELTIISERTDPAPGTHHVKYSSEVDNIEIIHTANSRKGFALGAVMAAEFIHEKKGVFTMKEVLGLH